MNTFRNSVPTTENTTFCMEQSSLLQDIQLESGQNFPPIYGTKKFLIAYTIARHVSQC